MSLRCLLGHDWRERERLVREPVWIGSALGVRESVRHFAQCRRCDKTSRDYSLAWRPAPEEPPPPLPWGDDE